MISIETYKFLLNYYIDKFNILREKVFDSLEILTVQKYKEMSIGLLVNFNGLYINFVQTRFWNNYMFKWFWSVKRFSDICSKYNDLNCEEDVIKVIMETYGKPIGERYNLR